MATQFTRGARGSLLLVHRSTALFWLKQLPTLPCRVLLLFALGLPPVAVATSTETSVLEGIHFPAPLTFFAGSKQTAYFLCRKQENVRVGRVKSKLKVKFPPYPSKRPRRPSRRPLRLQEEEKRPLPPRQRVAALVCI
ncbi:hypothetical protein DFH07DRAFT_945234 [Mycena maculata]|uniref:Uncharacterized protein n=1 Tax=Mycena maculata TaxID=230809 RepID=A0AAD7HYA7_9AGAR|nr:hypothetical protein DFH07DRAFT_945234 [Mycena maculata]